MGNQRKNLIIATSLVLATVVWGANNTTIGYIVRDWPVLWTTGTRLIFAGLLLMAVLRWTRIFGEPKPVPTDIEARLWWRGGLLFIGWTAGFWAWAVTYTPVAHASLYLAASPIWGLLLEERPKFQRDSIRKYFAALLALLGIIILFWPKLHADAGTGNSWIGDLIAFGASWSWTLYSRESRYLSSRVGAMEYTAQTSLARGSSPVAVYDLGIQPYAAGI